MSTYTQIIYQIVFTTKDKESVLIKENRKKLFNYIWGVLSNKKCHLYQINAVEDHIHIATSIHPSVALADVIREIKTSSSSWIKEEQIFPEFNGWQRGYGSFTYSVKDKNTLVNYIKNQEEHHKTISFREEYIKLLNDFDIEFNEKYLL